MTEQESESNDQSTEAFDTIHAGYLHPVGISNEFIEPETALEAIATSTLLDHTKTFLVTGVEGSGRTPLCGWLRDQLQNGTSDSVTDDRAVRYISADDGGFDTFFETLAVPVDVKPDITPPGRVTPENLAKTVLWRLQDRDYVSGLPQTARTDLVARRSGIDLFDIVTEHIRRSADGTTQLGAVSDLLSEEAYEQVVTPVLDTALQEPGREHLVAALHEGLRYALGGKDVSSLLDEISRAYLDCDARPVILCEDFTAVSPLLQHDLVEYFVDLQGHFDVVIAITDQWWGETVQRSVERSDVYCYLRDKATGYLSLSNSEGTPYSFDSESSVSPTGRVVTGRPE